MFPLLFYAPPLLGFQGIDVKSITGLTMMQGFFASLSAMFYYHENRLVNKPLVLTLGASLFASSLSGALISKLVPDKPILFIFAMLALIAAAMMLMPRNYDRDELTEEKVVFNKPAAIFIGIIIGFLIGLVGQGGAFITIPILLYVLKIPLRVALGSTLAIGLFLCNRRLNRKSGNRAGAVFYGVAACNRSVFLCKVRRCCKQKDQNRNFKMDSCADHLCHCNKSLAGYFLNHIKENIFS